MIVFPVSAKGKRAAAEGVVQKVGGDHESNEAAAEHAKAQGKEAPVAYQVKATGAIVYLRTRTLNSGTPRNPEERFSS